MAYCEDVFEVFFSGITQAYFPRKYIWIDFPPPSLAQLTNLNYEADNTLTIKLVLVHMLHRSYHSTLF